MSENTTSSGLSPAVAESANDVAAAATAQATDIGAKASAAIGDVTDHAKAKGASVAGQLKDQATAAVEQQKSGIADKLDDVAAAAHRSGEQMTGHQDWMAGLIERGATELGSLATTLRNNDLNGLLGNIQDLANRQPALFTGLAAVAGFALVRLGKVVVAGASRDDLPKMPVSIS